MAVCIECFAHIDDSKNDRLCKFCTKFFRSIRRCATVA